MAKGATHESNVALSEVKLGSDRSFGLVFVGVFIVVGLLPLADGGAIRSWALVVAAVFLTAALVRPSVLRPLNRLWFKFGMLLHHIVNPLVMGLLFFVTVTPVGLLMRATGKDPMRLKRGTGASYWIDRQPPGPAAESMKRQF